MSNVAFGYPYKLSRQANGWWLVRFPNVPEALTEGETKEEALENAKDCLITALEGYMKVGREIPRPPFDGERIVLPSLVTAKLAVYVNMRTHGWTRSKLANELGMPENSIRRLLDLRHSSHMWIIDEAMQKMNAELPIDLPEQHHQPVADRRPGFLKGKIKIGKDFDKPLSRLASERKRAT